MRQTYRVVASLIALGVLVQIAAVAFGWFRVITDVENGQVFDENSEFNLGHLVHLYNGMYVMPALAIVLLGVSFAAARSVPKARQWGGIVFGLVLLQVTLAFLGFLVAPAIGALHGLNAMLVLGASVRAAQLARTGTAAPAPTAAGAIPVPRTSSTGADLPA